MKKKSLVTIVVLIVAILSMVALSARAEKKKVADEFEINSDAKHFSKPKSKIPPDTELVKLSHKKHSETYKDDCAKCHHELKDVPKADHWAKAAKCSADGCHSANPHGPEKKCISLKSAMHDNCYKGCHKTDKIAMEKKAPTKCGDCHKKAK
ncbi:MAG: cytochrome c3 family protein [bacterium]